MMGEKINFDAININSEPPKEEPQRQYYFIAKCRKWVKGFEQKNGRLPEACVITFGCQMNSRDSDKLSGILEKMGFSLTDGEDADFVIYNTCTVRENANQKVYGHLGIRKSFQNKEHSQMTALCGCMMQEADEVEKIKKSYPFVDLIFGTHNIFRFAELTSKMLYNKESNKENNEKNREGNNNEYSRQNSEKSIKENSRENSVKDSEKNNKGNSRENSVKDSEKNNKENSRENIKKKKHKIITEIWDGTDQIVEELPEKLKYSFKAGVNIMFGCNNFCSYCIVPYVRGRERSRTPEDICSEIEELAGQGVVEVMLLGQNVNSYGKTLEPPVTFAQLLERVEKIEGIKRIRFMTPHPKDLSDELLEVIKNSKKICRQIHLPLQSGSSRILEKMNRHYTKEAYLELVGKIRKALPDAAISTDIIVGFPGETEEDFLDTMDVVKKAGFDSAFTFQYSKRIGTAAAAMEGQVEPETVKERFERLLRLIKDLSDVNTKKELGKNTEVLVEEENSHENGCLTGRMSNNRLVHFKGDAPLIGELVNVKLLRSCNFYYIGELVK